MGCLGGGGGVVETWVRALEFLFLSLAMAGKVVVVFWEVRPRSWHHWLMTSAGHSPLRLSLPGMLHHLSGSQPSIDCACTLTAKTKTSTFCISLTLFNQKQKNLLVAF
jgi:hypothetical protein